MAKNKLLAIVFALFITGCATIKPQGLYLFAVKQGSIDIKWANTTQELDSMFMAEGIKVLYLDSIVNSKHPFFDAKLLNKYIYMEKPWKNRNLVEWTKN